MKFWAAWREEDITDPQMYALRNHPLSTEQIHALFDHRPSVDLKWYQQLIDGGELAVSGRISCSSVCFHRNVCWR